MHSANGIQVLDYSLQGGVQYPISHGFTISQFEPYGFPILQNSIFNIQIAARSFNCYYLLITC